MLKSSNSKLFQPVTSQNRDEAVHWITWLDGEPVNWFIQEMKQLPDSMTSLMLWSVSWVMSWDQLVQMYHNEFNQLEALLGLDTLWFKAVQSCSKINSFRMESAWWDELLQEANWICTNVPWRVKLWWPSCLYNSDLLGDVELQNTIYICCAAHSFLCELLCRSKKHFQLNAMVCI